MGAAPKCYELIYSKDFFEDRMLEGGLGTSCELWPADQQRFCASSHLILFLVQLRNLLTSMAWTPSPFSVHLTLSEPKSTKVLS